MGFASGYLEKRALFPTLIKEAPLPDTGIIVVVPSYNEPGITLMLDSLATCSDPGINTEVIIIVNAPQDASSEILENNRKTISETENWKAKNVKSFFRLFAIDMSNCTTKDWGVGSARKTGMDEAVRRFGQLNRPDGVIMNLDADCTVAGNYFAAINDEFCHRKERKACSVYFEHPFQGIEMSGESFEAIVQYEIHLRYYYQGLKYAGFPNTFHTVGSAMGVKALPYVESGGMNRRKAGEDFYFIQKLFPQGGYFSLNETTVYPSSRISSRVPFGTGTIIGKLSGNPGYELNTYNVDSFQDLKHFFGMTERIFLTPKGKLPSIYQELPESLRFALSEHEWEEHVLEVRSNTSGYDSFKKRFFSWFNLFRIVKYMNSVHAGFFTRQPVISSSIKLLGLLGFDPCFSRPEEVLNHYRALEKSGHFD